MYALAVIFVLAILGKIYSTFERETKCQSDCGCGNCPDAWTYFDGSCYFFNDNLKVSWTEAVHHCEIHHSHLVVVDNRKEDLFLHDHSLKLFRNAADRKANDPTFWMGATDEIVEGLWIWYTDDSSLNYSNWAPGQPDSHNHVDEDCLMLYGYDNFTWHDGSCVLNNYPLCEKSVRGSAEIIG